MSSRLLFAVGLVVGLPALLQAQTPTTVLSFSGSNSSSVGPCSRWRSRAESKAWPRAASSWPRTTTRRGALLSCRSPRRSVTGTTTVDSLRARPDRRIRGGNRRPRHHPGKGRCVDDHVAFARRNAIGIVPASDAKADDVRRWFCGQREEGHRRRWRQTRKRPARHRRQDRQSRLARPARR